MKQKITLIKLYKNLLACSLCIGYNGHHRPFAFFLYNIKPTLFLFVLTKVWMIIDIQDIGSAVVHAF